jgi:hypothetical protein
MVSSQEACQKEIRSSNELRKERNRKQTITKTPVPLTANIAATIVSSTPRNLGRDLFCQGPISDSSGSSSLGTCSHAQYEPFNIDLISDSGALLSHKSLLGEDAYKVKPNSPFSPEVHEQGSTNKVLNPLCNYSETTQPTGLDSDDISLSPLPVVQGVDDICREAPPAHGSASFFPNPKPMLESDHTDTETVSDVFSEMEEVAQRFVQENRNRSGRARLCADIATSWRRQS